MARPTGRRADGTRKRTPSSPVVTCTTPLHPRSQSICGSGGESRAFSSHPHPGRATDAWEVRLSSRAQAGHRLAQPEQGHECQSNTRPRDVEDDIVDVGGAIAPPGDREVLHELDAAGQSERDEYRVAVAKTTPDERKQDAERDEEHEVAPCVPYAEALRARTFGQARG